MRTAFIEELLQAARFDDRLWLLTGDLGYSVLDGFAAELPDRFVNAGVAEQNMMGIAAGLALSGKRPYVYSIANFPVMRCLEQIRNDVCYHNLPVTVVSVGGGLVYGSLGYTHHGVEDLAIMRALPNMTVFAPADPVEARLVAAALPGLSGPAYVRLSKAGDPILHDKVPDFQVGRALELHKGDDVTLVSTGTALSLALDAHDLLARQGISAGVLSMPTVSPIDEAKLRERVGAVRLLATIEEHGPVGGLHAAVLEALSPTPVACVRFSLDSAPACEAGSAAYLAGAAGLTAESVSERVASILGA